MSKKLYEENDIVEIANAIRSKGVDGQFKVSEMANAINSIAVGDKEKLYYWCVTSVYGSVSSSSKPYIYISYDGEIEHVASYYGNTNSTSSEYPIPKNENNRNIVKVNDHTYNVNLPLNITTGLASLLHCFVIKNDESKSYIENVNGEKHLKIIDTDNATFCGIPSYNTSNNVLSVYTNVAEIDVLDFSEVSNKEYSIPNNFTKDASGTPNLHTIIGTPKAVGNYGLYNCSNLVNFDGSLLETVGISSFQNNTSLESLNCPNLKSISNQAFYGCTALKEVVIGGQITTINANVFNGCTNLTSVEIKSNKLTSISNYAFYECTSLKELKFPNITSVITLPSTTDSVFRNCPSDLKIYVPSSLVFSFKNNSSWSSMSRNIYAI